MRFEKFGEKERCRTVRGKSRVRMGTAETMTGLTRIAGLTALVSALAVPVFAQEAAVVADMADVVAGGGAPGVETVFILNSLLFLMAGFLVMFMAAGFAMLVQHAS